MTKKLNIIGCGKVGTTLGYLLSHFGGYRIQTILSRSLKTSLAGKKFFKQGDAISSYDELEEADLFLVAVSDDELPNAIQMLSTSSALKQSSIVFHVSGSFNHEIFSSLKMKGIPTASVHPIKSFSTPKADIKSFPGTYCTFEGDSYACKMLEEDFKKLGAKIIYITSANKMIYHIATIFSSNFFVALMEIALQLLEESDINRDDGFAMLEPLILGSFDKIKNLGTTQALTGPVARGDVKLVEKQWQLLNVKHPEIARAYKILSEFALEIAKKKASLPDKTIQKLTEVFKSNAN